jgi:hypothetical protein
MKKVFRRLPHTTLLIVLDKESVLGEREGIQARQSWA